MQHYTGEIWCCSPECGACFAYVDPASQRPKAVSAKATNSGTKPSRNTDPSRRTAKSYSVKPIREEAGIKRSLRLTAALAGAAIILAACTDSSDNDGEAALDEALDALNDSVTSLNDLAAEFESTLHDLEVRVEMVESGAGELALDFGRVGPSRAGFLPAPPEGKVTVQFVAESVDAKIPGTFRFFLAPEGEDLFETASLAEGETYEVGPELVDGIVPVDPGVLYMLKIVYENPTAEAMEFLVPGGTLDPQAALPYVRNRCWCAAIPFEVPANGTFTRVIQVGVGPDTPPGARAVMVWPVVRLDA